MAGGNNLGNTMTYNFDDIIENVETQYIIVKSPELTLSILPYFDLPAQEAAAIFIYKNRPVRLLKHLYKLIKLAMENPDEFEAKVYNAGLSYAGMIHFLNTWTKLSNLYSVYDPDYIGSDVIDNEEGVKHKALIKYLTSHIRKIAQEYNVISPEDNYIDHIFIQVSIEDEDE
jgi:hypothetical protein